MTLARRRFLHLAAAAAALPTAVRLARAQDYPSRPVRVIVPFEPGAQTDVIARLISRKLSERLNQQYYIENVTGAGGNIGAGRAALAAPDGYTMLVTPPSYVINPALYDKVPYDARTSKEMRAAHQTPWTKNGSQGDRGKLKPQT